MERIHVNNLRGRIAQLGATFMPTESALFKGRAHVYWIAARRTFVKATRAGDVVTLEYSSTCPCYKA